MRKLIVEEFEQEIEEDITFPKGFKYSHFKDPETGKYYRPLKSLEVMAEKLEDIFEEITEI